MMEWRIISQSHEVDDVSFLKADYVRSASTCVQVMWGWLLC